MSSSPQPRATPGGRGGGWCGHGHQRPQLKGRVHDKLGVLGHVLQGEGRGMGLFCKFAAFTWNMPQFRGPEKTTSQHGFQGEPA